MGNKDWDNYLRELLGDFKTEGETPHWDEFAQQLDPTNTLSEEETIHQDQILKERLDSYTPTDKVTGWERIEDSLNATDKAFDDEVHHRVKQYQAPSNPESWALFMKHFSSHKILRAKLIALKVVETAAIVLILFTVLQLGQVGKLPFISSSEILADSGQDIQSSTTETRQQQAIDINTIEAAGSNAIEPSSSAIEPIVTKAKAAQSLNAKETTKASPSVASISILEEDIIETSTTDQHNQASFNITVNPLANIEAEEFSESNETILSNPSGSLTTASTPESELLPTQSLQESFITTPIMSRNIQLENKITHSIPDPVYVRVAEKTYLEFGMLAQADYNQLKMPEDKLYNDGKQFVFPLQGITSSGYGAGFTLALGHSKWAFETGLIYSAKSFKPGRELTIGSISDNSNVDFEAMRMQVVSVPFQYRYRFDHKGRLKVYALAGFGLHYIAQSDVDVMVEHNFNSLMEGEDPNSIPSLARTIRQAQRVSDDLKDTAPFSSKSFISANLGAGIEYALADRKTLFLQSTYQYQIPNLRFSNHNGKHLLTVSLQAGVRTPLGS